ncbi:MAG: TlpA family protein disulfide reductase [Bacteroidaceae bacterium]|nr:TlpA family protein disulfide reductase [Bacteroidaceae bacterium]
MKKTFILATMLALLTGTFFSCDNTTNQEPYNPDSLFAIINDHYLDDTLAMEKDPTAYLLSLIDKHITNPVNHDRMIADMISMNMMMGGISDEIIKLKDAAISHISTDSIIERVNKEFDEIQKDYEKLKPGNAIPKLSISTPEGLNLDLADFKGKLLYVDVWATWCGPCIGEIPALEEVYKHFKGNDKIEIISISCDQDKDAWTQFLKENPHQWEQFIVTEEGQETLGKEYKVMSIPRFMVIDSQGKFIDADAIRPSDEGIISYLEGLLK